MGLPLRDDRLRLVGLAQAYVRKAELRVARDPGSRSKMRNALSRGSALRCLRLDLYNSLRCAVHLTRISVARESFLGVARNSAQAPAWRALDDPLDSLANGTLCICRITVNHPCARKVARRIAFIDNQVCRRMADPFMMVGKCHRLVKAIRNFRSLTANSL